MAQYLENLRPYLGNMIDDLKASSKQKIHLIMKINLVSSINNDDKQLMHSKSDNIEIIIGNKTDQVINKLFKSLLTRYQLGLEESMQSSDSVFGSFDEMYCKCQKISLNYDRSFINSPDQIKNNRSKYETVDPKNNNDKCFLYAGTAALSHKKIVKDSQRISKIKIFINNYNWKKKAFHRSKKIRKSVNLIITQLPLTFCLLKMIKKEQNKRIFQNIILTVKNE